MKRLSLLFIIAIITIFCVLSSKISNYADEKTSYVEKIVSIQLFGYDTGLSKVSYEKPDHFTFWCGVREVADYILENDILTIMIYIDIAVFFLVLLSIFILPPKSIKR